VKSKKSVIKDVLKPTSVSPKSSFTDPNDPWSAKANVAENITSKRADLLKQFYKSKGWNVNYISKNKKVSQSKMGDYNKWKRDHGIYEEDKIDEVSNELLGRYKTAAGSQASALDAAGGKENIQKANKRFSGIVKATKKQFANDDKKQGVSEAKDAGEYDYEGAMAKTQLQTICRNAEALRDMLDDDENLPEWVQAKITKAEDYITTSLDYLKSTDELEESIGLDEVLSKNAKAYDWIHDFVHSDNPKFDGKSKAQRMQMALAAYYAMQKRSRTNEDSVDPKAATQSPADGANGGETLAPPKKSIKRIVQEFHSSSRKVQEDLYDWEKDDKAAKPYGKKPTTQKIDGVNNIGDDKPNAKLILKGGKTLTGEPRDTVEIDPMLKNRSSMPDYKSMDKIKQKPQEQ